MGAYDVILRQINQTRHPERCPESHVKVRRNGDADITTCELPLGHDGPHKRGRKTWPCMSKAEEKP